MAVWTLIFNLAQTFFHFFSSLLSEKYRSIKILLILLSLKELISLTKYFLLLFRLLGADCSSLNLLRSPTSTKINLFFLFIKLRQ